jgi:hypothetical protein
MEREQKGTEKEREKEKEKEKEKERETERENGRTRKDAGNRPSSRGRSEQSST